MILFYYSFFFDNFAFSLFQILILTEEKQKFLWMFWQLYRFKGNLLWYNEEINVIGKLSILYMFVYYSYEKQ